jgi:Fe2+ transport system protein FeoA
MKGKLNRLSDLPNGCAAVIVAIDGTAAKLMELGFVPGARIRPAYKDLGGDPRVYELEGSLVALRRSAARHICVHVAGNVEKEGD